MRDVKLQSLISHPPHQWLAGDATNLLGALWQGLLPTMIILAIYYSLCDVILIFQVSFPCQFGICLPFRPSLILCPPNRSPSTSHLKQVFYYRRKRALYPELYSPLLAPSSLPTPPIATEHDPLLSSFSAHAPHSASLSPKMKKYRDLASYLGGAGVVVLVGAMAWWAAKDAPEGRRREIWETKAQVVGWVSAFLYRECFLCILPARSNEEQR